MLKKIKAIFKGTTLYDSIYRYKQRKSLLKWEASAVIRKGPLPHILKQYTIKDYASKYNCGILIETGTFEGDMIKAGLLFFQKIYSIELDQYFFLKDEWHLDSQIIPTNRQGRDFSLKVQ